MIKKKGIEIKEKRRKSPFTTGQAIVDKWTGDPLPVELISLTASSNSREVILNWSTATELNNHGFEIQRSAEGEEFFKDGFIKGHGTTTE